MAPRRIRENRAARLKEDRDTNGNPASDATNGDNQQRADIAKANKRKRGRPRKPSNNNDDDDDDDDEEEEEEEEEDGRYGKVKDEEEEEEEGSASDEVEEHRYGGGRGSRRSRSAAMNQANQGGGRKRKKPGRQKAMGNSKQLDLIAEEDGKHNSAEKKATVTATIIGSKRMRRRKGKPIRAAEC